MAELRVPPIAVTIAGSDSSGGAGIQADLKTFAALRVYGASVITALTAQNTQGVRAIHDVPADFVRAQIDAVFEDLAPRATKIGMLSRAETIRAVADGLRAHAAKRIVLDPVMTAKNGARLLEPAALAALKEELIGMAAVLTPNLPEAAVLLGIDVSEVARAPESACEKLLALGAQSVVLKGGHAGGSHSEDLFFDGKQWERLPAKRILTSNTHGTGCTFASAIAAALAHKLSPLEAAREAKAYITSAIEAGSHWRIGKGHGPVDHFFTN
ncbi:MAG TPA: bifunctional hydroxymethylpyrimidine kinase/phosphomethylpyrimidine kinase [Planctomycetota bacterium]|nr:bifunctional hydroxymethylpyrimidine kinase/phosphomethylpyrimidine kinase [Planctomycetota bacterium]